MNTLKLSRLDIRFMTPIYQITALFGMAPSYNFETCTIKKKMVQKIYGTLLVILSIVGNAYCLFYRQYLFKTIYMSSQNILDIINNIVMVAVNIIAILNSWCSNHWLQMHNNFQKIDKRFNTRGRKICNVLESGFLFLMVYMAFLNALICQFLYIWSKKLGFWTVCHTYIFYNLCYMGCGLSVVIITNLTIAIKLRYQKFTTLLETSFPKDKSKETRLQFLRDASRTFCLLSEIVREFNAIFGWLLLGLTTASITQMLTCLNLILTKSVMGEFGIEAGGIMHASFALFSSLCIMICSSQVGTEYKKAVLATYKLEQQFSEETIEGKEVLKLIREAERNVATITAADFFELNRNTLLSVLGTITTYLIVLLQFK